jgi:hypothetical protein
VMPNKLDVNMAPSGELEVTGGIFWTIIEFMGRARPKIPEKSDVRASPWTLSAAAVF